MPTLIVSPPSVTGHWVEEIEKFCGDQLSVLHYTGNNNERRKLQSLVSYNNIIVSSYEVIRNDSTFFHVSFKPGRPVPSSDIHPSYGPLIHNSLTLLSDVGGQGKRKSGQLCSVLVRPDRVFFENPDKIRTPDRIETDRIRTTDRHRTGLSGKSGQKRDTDRTRTVLSADV